MTRGRLRGWTRRDLDVIITKIMFLPQGQYTASHVSVILGYRVASVGNRIRTFRENAVFFLKLWQIREELFVTYRSFEGKDKILPRKEKLCGILCYNSAKRLNTPTAPPVNISVCWYTSSSSSSSTSSSSSPPPPPPSPLSPPRSLSYDKSKAYSKASSP